MILRWLYNIKSTFRKIKVKKTVLDLDSYEILEDAYKKHKGLIICFDFDNTVYDYTQEAISPEPVIKLLQECQKLDFCLICFTSELDPEKLKFKREYLDSVGLKSARINEGDGVVFPRSYHGGGYLKPYANIYLDDKAGLVHTYRDLANLVLKIKLNLI